MTINTFVVNTFFTARFAQEHKGRKENRKGIFLAEGQPNLPFFVLFVSFVVKAFFTARYAQERQGLKEGPPSNVFLPAGQQTCFSSRPLSSEAPNARNDKKVHLVNNIPRVAGSNCLAPIAISSPVMSGTSLTGVTRRNFCSSFQGIGENGSNGCLRPANDTIRRYLITLSPPTIFTSWYTIPVNRKVSQK